MSDRTRRRRGVPPPRVPRRDARRAGATHPGGPRLGRLLAIVPLVVAGGACEVADRDSVEVEALPAGVVDYLEPDQATSVRLRDGVTYHSVRSAVQPWSVHLLEVDPTVCDVGFQVVSAADETLVPVSELAGRPESGVVAAVNGDFFTPENRPIGLEASAGEIRGRSSRTVFAWKPGSLPSIGPVRWDGDSLTVGDYALSSTEPDGVTELISGFPPLLAGGRWVGDLHQGERPAFASTRHPRTALGWDPDRRRVWIVVADGRRERNAEGMTLPELAELFQSLGATEALNLDGGGSSVMVVRGRRVNRSGPAGERPVVNALVVRVDSAYCRVARAPAPPLAPAPVQAP